MHPRCDRNKHSLMPMPGASRSLNFAKHRRPSSQHGPALVDIGQPDTHFRRQAYTGDFDVPAHIISTSLEHRAQGRQAGHALNLGRVSSGPVAGGATGASVDDRNLMCVRCPRRPTTA